MRTVRFGLALVAIVALAACGDDDGGGSATADTADNGAASAAATVVVAEDIGFDADEYTAPAGEAAFEYRNDGAINHTLLIEGVDGFELEVNANGDVDEGTVELEPGSYTIFCDVPGHREAGMEATLEVS